MKSILVIMLMILTIGVSISQSEKEEIARLKRENEQLREEVRQSQARAEAAEKFAMRLRYLAIANALSEKSKSMNDKELSGLLVLQAYRFNVTHGGYEFDNSIYNGLYASLGRFLPQPKISGEFAQTDKISIEQRYSVSSNSMGVIELKDNKTGAFRKLSAHISQVNQFAFSVSGKYMVSAELARKILIWNLDNMTSPPRSIEVSKNVQRLEISIDDQVLRVTFSDLTQQVWLLSNDKLAIELEKFLTRNLSRDEWQIFIAADLPYEKTVASLPEGEFK